MAESAIIERRFAGPSESGNGGYSCGVVGTRVHASAAEVTLRTPPPLDRRLAVERSADRVLLLDADTLVAEGAPATLSVEAPPPPTWDEAVDASRRYPWRERHPYPRCFVCGPERSPGDGLCIYPGDVAGRDIAAAPFVPDATVADEDGRMRAEIVWATLDCPSWYGFNCFQPFTGGALLGRLAARIEERPLVGERCICVGWFHGRDGRKIQCGSALYTEGGALNAVGRATWIVLR
jgi:hypothetical protein